jgi:hypothetical protein
VVILLAIFTVAALLLLSFIAYAYKWSSKQQAGSAATAGPRRPGVSWQAGRWDTDSRHAYVANVGDDTAHEVSVTAFDQVVGTAQSVPPYRADRLSSSSEPPFYVNFCVHERRNQRISFGADRATRSAQGNAVDPDPLEVLIRVSWSDHGEWFSQTVRTD